MESSVSGPISCILRTGKDDRRLYLPGSDHHLCASGLVVGHLNHPHLQYAIRCLSPWSYLGAFLLICLLPAFSGIVWLTHSLPLVVHRTHRRQLHIHTLSICTNIACLRNIVLLSIVEMICFFWLPQMCFVLENCHSGWFQDDLVVSAKIVSKLLKD